MAGTFLHTRGLCRVYTGGEEVRALDGVSFSVDEGEFVAIVGRSGSGKSTLMNLLGCLDVPTAGEYCLGGRAVSTMSPRELTAVRNRTVGFVFQGFCLLPSLTALENVELPLVYRGVPPRQRRQLAEKGLERVGLSARMHHRPGQLSGGQQQRVAIARALVGQPQLILADEPTGNLDAESGQAVMSLLHALHAEGTTVVLITHDMGVAAQAQRVLYMDGGHLTDVAPSTPPSCIPAPR